MHNRFENIWKYLIVAFFAVIMNVYPQQEKNEQPVKVACIGNSITSGSKNKQDVAYPAFLGKLLGKSYDVVNFGVSGRTLLRNGDYPYWKEKTFQEAIDFNPDIVIIKLGTNDSKPQNWKYKDKGLKSNPKIYICKPVPAFRINFNINDSVIVNEIIPKIENIGKENNVELLDLYTPFINEGRVFPDGIHPDPEGAEMLAKEIYKAIIK